MVRSHRCQWRDAPLLANGERGALRARDRRLWLFGVIARSSCSSPAREGAPRGGAAETDGIIERFESRIRDGYLYGDFQFATDATRDSFLQRGIFSTYQPVPDDTPLTPNPTRFNPEDWARLTFYAHKYKRRAFEVYSTRYLATSGQIYWADSQLSAGTSTTITPTSTVRSARARKPRR